MKTGEQKFMVKTHCYTTTFLGTDFNIRAYPGQDEAILSLYEGSVEMSMISGKFEYRIENNIINIY